MHSIARRVLGLVLTEHQPWMTGIGNVDLHGFAVRPFGRRFHALDALRRERFVCLRFAMLISLALRKSMMVTLHRESAVGNNR